MDKIREMMAKFESGGQMNESNRALLDNLEGKLLNLQTQLQDVRDQKEQSQQSHPSPAISGTVGGAAAGRGGGRRGRHNYSYVAGRGSIHQESISAPIITVDVESGFQATWKEEQ